MRGKKRRNSSSHLQWLVVAPSPVPPRWGALAREFLDQGRVVPERSVVVSRCVLKLEGESVSRRGYGMREGSPSRSPASVPLRLERLSTASRSSFNSRFLSTLPLLSLYSPLHRGDDRAPFARGNAPPLGSICDDADACRNAKAGSNKVSREVSKPPGHERVRLRLGSRRAGRASILGELVGLGRCREEHGFEFVTEREKKKKKRKTLQFLKSLFFSLSRVPSRSSPGSSSQNHQARHPEAGGEWKRLSQSLLRSVSSKKSLPGPNVFSKSCGES